MSGRKRTNNRYSEDFKAEAVRLHVEEGMNPYQIARMLGIRSKTQVQQWVKKYQDGALQEDLRGKTAWRKGRPKTKFSSLEEELAYIKAENDYLKKRYPNLHGE
jgi:transposase-like protein